MGPLPPPMFMLPGGGGPNTPRDPTLLEGGAWGWERGGGGGRLAPLVCGELLEEEEDTLGATWAEGELWGRL